MSALIFLGVAIIAVIMILWPSFSGIMERKIVMQYREDNLFRVQHVVNTINSSKTVEQLDSTYDWGYKICKQMGEELKSMCPNTDKSYEYAAFFISLFEDAYFNKRKELTMEMYGKKSTEPKEGS